MTWFDYSLIAILFLTTLLGVWNGVWWQIYRVISLVLSYILAVRFHYIGSKLCEKILDEKTAKVAGCVLVFVVVLAGTYLLGRLIKKVLGTKPGIAGRISGGILGLLKGVLICSVASFCLLEYNTVWQKENLQTSPLTNTFARAGTGIVYIVPDRLRIDFETFVKDALAKTKEAVNDITKLEEIGNKLKQYKK